MTAAFTAVLILAGITLCALPYYCVITYRGKNKQTLVYKMILSSLFVTAAFVSMLSMPGRPVWAFWMTAGFCMSFIGDYLLGKSDRMRIFVAGSCCFAAAHVCYITAFSKAGHAMLPQLRWFNGLEIGIFAAIMALELLIVFVKHPPFHKLFIPMFAYYCFVALTATKALGLAIRLAGDAPMLVMLPIGALFFVGSDYTLGLMRFKMHPRTVPMKTFCTASYFVAQMLMVLASFTLYRL